MKEEVYFMFTTTLKQIELPIKPIIGIQYSVCWEAGHYYQSYGPTKWTEISWKILEEMAHPDDCSLVMIDDVHKVSEMNPLEQIENIPRPELDATTIILESQMEKYGWEVLNKLNALPSRRKRPRKRGKDGRWVCSGSLLTTPDSKPMCLLYDLGLTWFKYNKLCFRHVVNILPEFYFSEQHALMRIARRIMPDLRLEAVLFDLEGRRRLLRLD